MFTSYQNIVESHYGLDACQQTIHEGTVSMQMVIPLGLVIAKTNHFPL